MERLFEKNGFTTAKGVVTPISDFKLFSGYQAPIIQERFHNGLIERAEKLLGKEYPMVYASDYYVFRRNGDRSTYEKRCLQRRGDLLALVNAEAVEKKGRFIDSICNLIWMTLEESTWVVNSHQFHKKVMLTEEYDDNVEYVEISSAYTGVTLAYAYYSLKEQLDAITPVITERIKLMLRRRLIIPFINAGNTAVNAWTKRSNNFCPWTCSNVLFATAVVEDDIELREKVVTAAMGYLDNFIEGYPADGGCDEGAVYWNVAGASYVDSLDIIRDMTDGKINILGESFLKPLLEYIAKVYVADGYSLNFADSAPRPDYKREMLVNFARDIGSEVLYGFGASRGDWPPMMHHFNAYRGFRCLCTPDYERKPCKAPTRVFFENLQIAATRETEYTEKGLYIALKGGHNGESHNHNDLGSFIVFSDGKPMFIDMGQGGYTGKYFSPRRYEIPSVNSNYHNTLNFGDTVQRVGEQFKAKVNSYDRVSGKMALDLSEAYPAESNVISYTREAVLENAIISIRDTYKLSKPMEAKFVLMLIGEPENVEEDHFTYLGRTVTFDPALKYSIEAVDCDTEEMRCMPPRWNTNQIYRILLTSPATDSGDFTLTIR